MNFPGLLMVLFSWIYLRKYLLPCLFFQAFAPSVLFLLDFPVVAWSRSSSDSVHKVWNKSDGEDSNNESIFPSELELLIPALDLSNLYFSYLAKLRRYSQIALKLHVLPTARIYSTISMMRTSTMTSTNKWTKNKVTLCKMIQTSAFYDVHAVSELRDPEHAYIRNLVVVSGEGARLDPPIWFSCGVLLTGMTFWLIRYLLKL